MSDLLQALRTATLVARSGSFSAAARQLGVTPAAVSKSVAQLETRLATRLFERSTRQVLPTDEGRDLLRRLAPPLQALDEILEAPLADAGPAGRVKVSVPASFARMALLPGLADFLARHPGVEVDLRLENRRVDLVAEGYDCAIGATPAPDATVVARNLLTIRPVLCAAPDYIARRGLPDHPAALADHALIGLRSDSTGLLRDWTLTWKGRRHTVAVSHAGVSVGDPECAAAAAVAGCGVALVGLHHVVHALQQRRLVQLLPGAQAPAATIAVYFARRRLLPRRTRAFVDHVMATVPQADTLRLCAQWPAKPGATAA